MLEPSFIEIANFGKFNEGVAQKISAVLIAKAEMMIKGVRIQLSGRKKCGILFSRAYRFSS